MRRITLEIYDKDEVEKAYNWIKENRKEGFDKNAGKELPEIIKKSKVVFSVYRIEFEVDRYIFGLYQHNANYYI